MLSIKLPLCALLLSGIAVAQTARSQTPREALIEMISSPTPGTFQKHLLKEFQGKLQQAMEEQQSQSMLLPMILLGMANQNATAPNGETKPSTTKWYSVGPLLAMTTDPKNANQVEVLVEKDQISGSQDEMELSFRFLSSKPMPNISFAPKVQLHMVVEDGIWKLSEVGFSARVKLDAALVDGFMQAMQQTPPHVASKAEDSAAAQVRALVAAEKKYRAANPQIGFTCSLDDLAPYMQPSTPSAVSASLADAQASYHYAIYGCHTTPSTVFRLTAVPTGGAHGRRAFCTDQSGVLRYSDDGHGVTCLSENHAVNGSAQAGQ